MQRKLELILKVVERCNINCSYCYYFNAGTDAPLARPAMIDEAMVENVAGFIDRSVAAAGLDEVMIVFHGGEPLMMKKKRFDAMCAKLSEVRPRPHLSMTTNAILVDDEWLDLFEKHQLDVCISIDGPAEYHDRERVDFKGRGTHDRVVRGLRRVQERATQGRIRAPTALAVIDTRSNGGRVYDHIARELGVRHFDFLVPNLTHDDVPAPDHMAGVHRYLQEAFREWTQDDDPSIHIRIFNRFMNQLMGHTGHEYSEGTLTSLIVGSDGSIWNDDSMEHLDLDIFKIGLNVKEHSVVDYLNALHSGDLAGGWVPHSECTKCNWYKVCRPPFSPWGQAFLRYRKENGFDNKLTYCETYKGLFRTMESYIASSTIM